MVKIRVDEEHRGMYRTQQEACRFLDDSVAGSIGAIRRAVSHLSSIFCSREKKHEALETIRYFTKELGELYVARALIGGDTMMEELGFTLYDDDIKRFLTEDLGYEVENDDGG